MKGVIKRLQVPREPGFLVIEHDEPREHNHLDIGHAVDDPYVVEQFIQHVEILALETDKHIQVLAVHAVGDEFREGLIFFWANERDFSEYGVLFPAFNVDQEDAIKPRFRIHALVHDVFHVGEKINRCFRDPF